MQTKLINYEIMYYKEFIINLFKDPILNKDRK